jgi:hypothetical protein
MVKKILFYFPPHYSKYLYSFDNDYKWKNINNALNFRYNSFRFFNKIKGVSSGELLYIICNISKLHDLVKKI